MDESSLLEFVNARHPVVERRMEDSGSGRFVPNSLYLDADGRPCCAADDRTEHGRQRARTLRMAALLVVMAQCGSFVPAERMRLGSGGPHLHPHWRQR